MLARGNCDPHPCPLPTRGRGTGCGKRQPRHRERSEAIQSFCLIWIALRPPRSARRPYLQREKPLPRPRAKGRSLVEVAVAPDVAAKLAVLEAFRDSGVSKADLARRIGKDEKEIRRILDPKHPTKLPALTAALRALGKRLVVGVAEAA